MEIVEPIVIVGTGRCGSTLLHRLLAQHDDVGWLSTWNEVFPHVTGLSRFSNLYRYRFLGHRLRHMKFFPKPFENYRFWEAYLPGFSRRERPLTAGDVPEERIAGVRQAVARVLKAQERDRLLVKVTGWARMEYFDRIFPDARFIWLQRNGRSVVSSWIQAGWLDVTSSPDSPDWQWGTVPEPYHALWQELEGGPVLSAALKIQLDLDDIRRNMQRFPDRTLEISYEELVSEPQASLHEIGDFAHLSWSHGLARAVRATRFYDSSDKWRKYLSHDESDTVLDFFRRASAYELWRVPA
jgi:hypothetical protein